MNACSQLFIEIKRKKRSPLAKMLVQYSYYCFTLILMLILIDYL